MQKPENKSPFLNAWRDNVANLSAIQSNIRLCDLQGDGDQRLIVADQSQRIIAYKNVNIEWDTQLSDLPTCLSYFYPPNTNCPTIAIGCDKCIYLYRNKKAHFKTILPILSMPLKEKQLWESYDQDQNKLAKFINDLSKLRTDGVNLSYKSLDVLAISSLKKQHNLIVQYIFESIDLVDTPICMEFINKHSEDENSTSQLIVGTEYKKIYVLDENGYLPQQTFDLESVGTPCFIVTQGTLLGDWTIYVALRENQIIFIKNGQLSQVRIAITSKPLALIKSSSTLVIGQMNDCLDAFDMKGVKLYTIKMSSGITAIEKMESVRLKLNAVLVATQTQEVFIYNGKILIYSMTVDGIVQGMRFGVFGREDGTLVLIYKRRGIDVKMIGRKFNFQQLQQEKKDSEKSTQEETPLNLPKKTKLFIEQSQRERDDPLPIHKNFQKDLMKLRLKTAQYYIQTLNEGVVMNNILNTDENMRLSASVQGLGPLFKLLMNVENLSNEPLTELYINYIYDPLIFKIKNPIRSIPFLLPHISLPLAIQVQNVDQSGTGDCIIIMICSKKKHCPLIGAIVNMPLSELRQD